VSYSLDANILLYASNTAAPEHAAARQFLESCAGRAELLCLGWPTLMAYLRISTHSGIFPSPLTQEEAQRNVDGLANLPHVRLISEADGYWDLFTEVTRVAPARGNQVPDAHLATLLKQHDVSVLYTNDADFRRFEFLEVRALPATSALRK